MTKSTLKITMQGETLSIDIFDVIDDDMAASVNAALKANRHARRIELDIHSPGGDVFAGFSIYNQLLQHKARVIAVCTGLAASAASLIFMAGDERIMRHGSRFMIHESRGTGSGSADEFDSFVKQMRETNRAAAEAYASRSNLTYAQIRKLMADETWFTAQECLQHGFATRVDGAMKVAASLDPKFVSTYRNIPGDLMRTNSPKSSSLTLAEMRKRIEEAEASARASDARYAASGGSVATSTMEARRHPVSTMQAHYTPSLRNDPETQHRMMTEWHCSAHACNLWLRAVAHKDKSAAHELRNHACDVVLKTGERKHILDAQSVDDLTKGGALVPAVMTNRILQMRDELSIAGRCAAVYPMASEHEIEHIPVQLGSFTPQAQAQLLAGKSKNAGGVGEAAEIPTSEMTFGLVEILRTDKYCLTQVSKKLLRSSSPSVIDWLANQMANDLAVQLDWEYIRGDGNPGGTNYGVRGLVASLGAAGIQAASGNLWDEITLADFRNLVGILPARFHTRAKWIMSPAFYAKVVDRLRASIGTTADFMGYPIELTAQMPTVQANSQVCCLLGDFYNSSVLAEDEAGYEIAVSTEWGFSRDVVGVRSRKGYDIQVYRGGDGSNAGGYVGLRTAAS